MSDHDTYPTAEQIAGLIAGARRQRSLALAALLRRAAAAVGRAWVAMFGIRRKTRSGPDAWQVRAIERDILRRANRGRPF